MGRLKEFYKKNIRIYLTWQNAMWACLFAGIWSGFWVWYMLFASIFWWQTYLNFKTIYPAMVEKYQKRD